MNAKQLIEAGISEISDRELEERYNEMLNQCYEPVKICGYEYLAGDALVRVDPIAYRCGFADWISSESGETIIEVDGKYKENQHG